MSIIGVTVGTPTSPKRIEDEIKPVKTVNGNAPDENGNVEVVGNNGADGTNGKDGKDGVDGISPTISVSTITGGHRITIIDKDGTKTVDVMDGADGADGEDGKDGTDGTNGTNGKDGRGIKSVARTSGNGAAGTTDIYTITYTDNTTSTFTVYNGKNGTNGKDGADGTNGKDGTSVTITNVNESTADGGSNTVTFSDGKTLTVKNGSKGSAGKDGSDGANGADGRGIKTIQRVNGNGAAGTTDRYQVAYTDDTSTYFYIYNGADGTNGDDGKSAYQYAQDGGYTGTEEEFSAKLAAEQDSNNPLYGKKVSFLGDSICAGADTDVSYLGGYGKIIADRNNMDYENLGRGGAVVTAETYSNSTGEPLPWLCQMVENMSSDADYAIIEGGLNDTWYVTSEKMGSITTGFTEALDESTFCGAFESMLKKLITKFQGKKIGYIAVPKIHSMYDSEQNVPNFYHLALACCAKWGVPVCDLNTTLPSFEYLKTLGTIYTPDGTHPTYEGYIKYYCDPIEAWLKTLTTGGNNSATMARNAVEEYTKGFNDAITALQNGKLNNTGISFKKAKLTLVDGTILEIDVLTAVDGTLVIPFVNRLPISIDTDKTIYGVDYDGDGTKDGYKKQTRLSSSSGVVKENTDYASVMGFVPVEAGDICRLQITEDGTYLWDEATMNAGWNIIAYYDSSFTWLGSLCPHQSGGVVYGICTSADQPTGSSASKGIVSFTVPSNNNIAYVRLSFSDQADKGLSSVIFTVNEEIE